MRSLTYTVHSRRVPPVLADEAYPRPLLPSDKIKNLPPELLFEITDLLTPESVMALSLASSRLRFVLQDKVKLMKRSRENLQRLLLLLERTSPHLLACFTCHKLYDWKRSDNYACPNYNTKTHLRPLSFNDKLSCVYPAVIDLIFRARKLGPDFGLPLSFLDCPEEYLVSTRSAAEVCRISQARLRNNILILRCMSQSTIYINKNIEEQLAPLKATSCGHVNHLLSRAITDLQTQVLDVLNRNAENYDIYGLRAYSCTQCSTDIHIVLDAHKNDFSKVYITMDILHKFNARTPTRLVPKIEIQNENGIQNAVPFPNIRISRNLLAQFHAWQGPPIHTSMVDKFCRWVFKKWFMQGWKKAEPLPPSADGLGLHFRVHVETKQESRGG